MALSIGIDLGTTFSAAAIVEHNGRPVVVKNSDGNPITPSVIAFNGSSPLVGDEAKEMQALGEANIASFFKRSMGDRGFILEFNGQKYTPTQLSAIVLKKIKADSEKELGGTVTQAVITVPAYFNNFQRKATIEAGEMAGLEVLRIINEPTAAALAYGLDRLDKSQTLLVYDLGGGTFDVTIVKLSDKTIKVIATGGDHELGGKDWDDRIATFLGGQFQQEFGKDPLDDEESFQDLLTRTENAKKQLSKRDSVNVSIVHDGEKGSYTLTRERFEEMTADLMERTRQLCEQVLQDCGLGWRDIEGVLLVGGSTRMPMVHEFVTSMCGKKPLSRVNVDEAVALGAAIQAHMDSNGNNGGKSRFSLAGKSKETQDVMSHSMGMVAENQDRSRYVNSIIIAKNKPIPYSETRPYQLRTSRGKANNVEVYMLQGEHQDPLKCNILGKYVFSDISHTASRHAVLDIQYQYDRNGVVSVAAVQRETGQPLPLTVEPLPDDMSWLALPPKDHEEFITPHMSVIMAVDLSGSMSGKPLLEAQAAAKRFIRELDLSHTSVGLMVFADKVHMATKLCQNAKELERGIDNWKRIMNDGKVGWGNAADPFTQSLDLLNDLDDPRFIVTLTDGVWNHQRKAIERAQKCLDNGIEIIAVGFGGADRKFLKEIATSDESALFTDLSQLVVSFSKIAQILTEAGGEADTTHQKNGKTKRKGFLKFFN